jgi:hypothetical protein
MCKYFNARDCMVIAIYFSPQNEDHLYPDVNNYNSHPPPYHGRAQY